MPRYHFNIHDGAELPDDVGTELPDLAAARIFAVRLAGECLRDHAAEFWNGEEWKMDVADDQGLIQFTLMFVGMDAPSIPRAPRE